MKQWVAGMMVALLALWPAWAADLTRGVTFTDGQRVTAAQLHNLVDATSISTAFYANQTAQSTLTGTDVLLVYSPTLTGWRKMTANGLLYNNTALITGQSAKAVPTSADYVLAYDAAGLTLVKVSVAQLVLNNTNLIAGAAALTNVLQNAQLLVLNDGTNNRVTVSNLFWSLETWNKPLTNLATHTAPTNLDTLVIWDSLGATNKKTTLIGLVTNAPTATGAALAGTNLLPIVNAGVVSQVTWSTLSNNIATNLLIRKFVSYDYPLASGLVINTNHGFARAPELVRAVFVCVTSDKGYAVLDEVTADGISAAAGQPTVSSGANATNVFAILNSTTYGSFYVRNKSTGADDQITEARWKLRIYAEVLP